MSAGVTLNQVWICSGACCSWIKVPTEQEREPDLRGINFEGESTIFDALPHYANIVTREILKGRSQRQAVRTANIIWRKVFAKEWPDKMKRR